ncbi:c-type cytochrome domain-containing protein [Paraflavisolibacter sp. H34]|uniref:c-type cytochrome domain-containing protein n=1 Tax=Huijunlia imazamoxiresistens TaxID=3127457 RepID=UPI00301775AE
MKQIFSFLLAMAVTGLVVVSCSKDDEQTVSPKPPAPENPDSGNTCATANMKFSTDIRPILVANCFECHGNGEEEEGVNFDTYEGVRKVAKNGELVGTISHAPGYKKMPYKRAKLPDCEIARIKAWVDQGYLNN